MKEKLKEITWDQKQNTYKDLQIFSRKTTKSLLSIRVMIKKFICYMN